MKTTKELIIADITAKVEAKLASHKVDLSLLDNLSNIMMESGSLLVLQKQQLEAAQKLDKSIVLNKKGLAEAQRGLAAATDLGEPKAIEIFKGWVKSFTTDLSRAEKGKKLVANLSNI
jgi:hypothetical protein